MVIFEIEGETCGEASILVGGAYQSALPISAWTSRLWLSAELRPGLLLTNQCNFYEIDLVYQHHKSHTIPVEETS